MTVFDQIIRSFVDFRNPILVVVQLFEEFRELPLHNFDMLQIQIDLNMNIFVNYSML